METTEELPRCETASKISKKLEDQVAKLILTGDFQLVQVIINLKGGRISKEERKKALEVITARHPNLMHYLIAEKIKYLFVKGSGQIVAEVKLDQVEGLSKINHGEITDLDYNGNRLNDYIGL